MTNESGRSLIEMLGVLALAGIIAIGAIRMHQTARVRQQRFMAEQDLRELAENARILYSGRRNFSGISKNHLIASGALRTDKIAGHGFRVEARDEGRAFAVIFDAMNLSDCAFFATRRFDWAYEVRVNGFADNPSTLCAEIAPNRLEFIVR